MKKVFWKSKRFWGLILTALGAFPQFSSPVWDVLLDAGVPGQWVARGQLAAMVAGLILSAYGSAVADRKWGLS